MWHHFPTKSGLSQLKKILHPIWGPKLQAWVQPEFKSKAHERVFRNPSSLDQVPNGNLP